LIAAWLSEGIYMFLPNCVALFCIVHYASLSVVYCGVEPEAASDASCIHTGTSTCLSCGLVRILDQAVRIVCVELILSFFLICELDCKQLVICISRYHAPCPEIFWHDQSYWILGLHCWLHISL